MTTLPASCPRRFARRKPTLINLLDTQAGLSSLL
jgi:hypothetical protein